MESGTWQRMIPLYVILGETFNVAQDSDESYGPKSARDRYACLSGPELEVAEDRITFASLESPRLLRNSRPTGSEAQRTVKRAVASRRC